MSRRRPLDERSAVLPLPVEPVSSSGGSFPTWIKTTVAVLGLLGAGIGWAMTQDRRLTRLEAGQEYTKDTLTRIEHKLDAITGQ